jgi:hypothetical protein
MRVILGCELEKLVVRQTLELPFLIESTDVVPELTQATAHPPPGDVGVEDKSHRLLAELEERVELTKLFQRPPVLSEEGFDLLGEALRIPPATRTWWSATSG